MSKDQVKPQSVETRTSPRTDPMLLLAAKLDRILDKAEPNFRAWAVGYLAMKYGVVIHCKEVIPNPN